MARTGVQIEGGGAATVKSTPTTGTYRPKSSRDTIAPLPAPKPTATLPPTRTATQDWTVLQQRPDRPVTSITPPTTGGGGGGYTPTTAPPPPPQRPEVVSDPVMGDEPTGPGGAGGNASADMLDQFTAEEIEAALLALEAQYGMDRESLLQDQSLIGAQYRLLMTRLNRARVQGIEGATNDAVSRGIYRSGILGENVQTIENDYMEQARASEEQRLAQEQGIQSQLDFMEAQKAAQAAQIQSGLRREQANYLLQAGVSPNPGNGAFVQVPQGVPPVQSGAPAYGQVPGAAPQGQFAGGVQGFGGAPNMGALSYEQLLQQQQYGMI